VKITIISAIVLYSAAAIIMGILLFPAGFILFIIPAIYILLWCLWKKRIPFTSLMLEEVAFVIKRYKASIYAGFLGSMVNIIVCIFLIITLIYGLLAFGFLGMLLPLFSIYYTIQVANNVVHVTVSGLFASYFFRSSKNPATNEIEINVKNPTWKSFVRAMTTSFGSICYGSLIIALIEIAEAIVKKIKNDLKRCCCCCCCFCCFFDHLLAILDRLVKLFNKYAFTQVAIYGKPYSEAAKSTWELIKSNGVDAILNDLLISKVLSIGKLVVGLVAGGVTALLGYITGVHEAILLVYEGLLAFFIAYFIFSIVSKVIDSCVVTMFVCICEDSEAIKYSRPELYNKIKETYPKSLF